MTVESPNKISICQTATNMCFQSASWFDIQHDQNPNIQYNILLRLYIIIKAPLC